MRRFPLVLLVGVVAAFASAAAAADLDMCALLTPAELDAVAGVKVPPAGTPSEQPLPAMAGVLKGLPRVGCSWTVGDQGDAKTMGNVYVSLVRLTAEQAGAGMAFRKAHVDYATGVGFQATESKVAGASCSVLKPPTNSLGLGPATGCSVETKDRVVALDVSGQVTRTSPEAVKAALDKAVSRLP